VCFTSMKGKLKYLNLLGLALLIIILLKIDIGQTLSYLRNADYRFLLMAYPFILLLIVLKSVRWNLLMRNQGVRFPFLETFSVYLWGFYFGVVTPGRIGEASKALYVKERFGTFGQSFVAVVVDRVFDLAMRTGLLFILYPLYSELFDFQIIGFFILLIILAVGIVILIRMRTIQNIIGKLSTFILPARYYPRIRKNISGFINDTVAIARNIRLMIIATLFSFLAILCYSIISYLILMSYNIRMDYLYNFLCIIVGSLMAIIPISISGLGVREATMIYLFSNVGLDKESAVLFSLSLFSINILLGIHGALVNVIMMVRGFRKVKEDGEGNVVIGDGRSVTGEGHRVTGDQ